MRKTKPLGQILIEEGLLNEEQLQRALSARSEKNQLLGRVLIDLGLVKEADLVGALAKQLGLQFVDLSDIVVDSNAASLIPEQVARRYRALPVGFDDSRLIVAMADPANLFALDDIRTITGMEVKPVVATAADIESAIRKYGAFDESVESMASAASEQADEEIVVPDVSGHDEVVERALAGFRMPQRHAWEHRPHDVGHVYAESRVERYGRCDAALRDDDRRPGLD